MLPRLLPLLVESSAASSSLTTDAILSAPTLLAGDDDSHNDEGLAETLTSRLFMESFFSRLPFPQASLSDDNTCFPASNLGSFLQACSQDSINKKIKVSSSES